MSLIVLSYMLFAVWSNFPSSTEATIQQFTPVAQAAETIEVEVEEYVPIRPELIPESMVLKRGSKVGATVTGFAPGEVVELRLGTKVLDKEKADEEGSADFSFTAPYGGISFELTAFGVESGLHTGRFLRLAK